MKKTATSSIMIYVRDRSREIAKRHLMLLEAYAVTKGLVVEGIFMDIGSAHDASRPGLMALNEATEQRNVSTILVMTPEALFRGKYLDTALFRQMLFGGVEIMTPYEKPRSFDETAYPALYK
ncbi:hypothetical protein ACF3MZ_14300 [Paenibacillaceae bacterium WGS1546]|uniref:hypothetical protein n=1 Tax=Cohnella sp. WGS1546 TaxID=3366810 RepID=UPI00372CFF46